MTNLNSFLVTRATAESALAEDGMTLDDYEPTILGLVSDGETWQVLEDSLEEAEALEWAQRAAGYGEIVGLFVWAGQS
jgi:hypothetical protein